MFVGWRVVIFWANLYKVTLDTTNFLSSNTKTRCTTLSLGPCPSSVNSKRSFHGYYLKKHNAACSHSILTRIHIFPNLVSGIVRATIILNQDSEVQQTIHQAGRARRKRNYHLNVKNTDGRPGAYLYSRPVYWISVQSAYRKR